MSLRKSPTLTRALLAANRANAKKSTGPRTARGKAFSRLNRMKDGKRSPEYVRFLKAMLNAPMGQVGLAAQGFLLSQPVIHPLFMEAAKLSVQVEIDLTNELRWKHQDRERRELKLFDVRSGNINENKH